MKKLLAIALAAIMVLSLFAACTPAGPQGTQGTQGTEGTKGTEADVTVKYPIDTNVTLTMFRGQNNNITSHFDSFGDTPVGKYLSKASGINVVYHDKYTDQEAAWTDMLSTGAFTDMISFNPVGYEGGAVDVLADGLGIELNDVIDKYMPNFKAFLAAHPEVDSEIKTDDGIYYYIPYINSNTGAYSHGSYYRADLLAEMGEKEPTTMEGWYNLLKKVKDKYPDMIPYSTTWENIHRQGMFAMAYGVGGNSTSNDFDVVNGEVRYQRSSDAWKAYMKEMNKWYKEGLIDVDVFAIASGDVNAKMISGKVFMMTSWLSAMQNNQIGGRKQNEKFQLKAVGTPALKEGQAIEYGYATKLISGVGTTISSACQNVEMAARFLDYLFSEEGHLAANYGEPGVGYDMVDGAPTFHDDVVVTPPEGYNQSQSAARYSAATTGAMAMVKHEDYYPQLMAEKCAREAIYIWQAAAVGGGHMHELPLLTLDEDEAEIVAGSAADIKTLSTEWAAKFIKGEKDAEADWAEYIAALEDLKLADVTESLNSAFDRYADR